MKRVALLLVLLLSLNLSLATEPCKDDDSTCKQNRMTEAELDEYIRQKEAQIEALKAKRAGVAQDKPRDEGGLVTTSADGKISTSAQSKGSWFTRGRDGSIKLTGHLPPGMTRQRGWIYLSDGRICKNCTVLIKQGVVLALLDKDGFEWEAGPEVTYRVDKHPYLRLYGQAAAVGAQQYGQQMQQNAQRQMQMQQQNRPVNTNCSSYGAGYSVQTNCYSY